MQDYDMHEAVSDIWLVVDKKRYHARDNKGSDQAWDNYLAVEAAKAVRDRNAEELIPAPSYLLDLRNWV